MAKNEITVYERSVESLEIRLQEKRNRAKVKMTTYCVGETKNLYIDDCLRMGIVEAEVLRRIIKVYYRIIAAYPDLKNKDLNEREKWIQNKLNNK